ncbi:MAG TPA: sugar kinase, partial [Nitrospirae bacterium]|nr:sugar kinase [Nitrospirota bacterium]
AGDDGEGGKIRDSLHREGLDTSGLLIRSDASSQVAFIVVEKGSGKRTIFWRRPTGREVSPEELKPGFPGDSRFLLLDGLMKDVSLYAAAQAVEAGIPVMLDAGRLREGMTEIAKRCDFVVGSEEFAKDLGYNGDLKKFHGKIKDLGFKITTITLGERGSITFLKDRIIEIDAFDVATVDTTGAGDVFHGGYIYGLLRGWPLEDTIRFASALAAMKCLRLGGRAGIPDLQAVLAFLKRRGIFLPGGF